MTKKLSIIIILALLSYNKMLGQGNKLSNLTPQKTCLTFLKWYVSHQATLNVPANFILSPPGDTTKPYRVDLEHVTKYKSSLKNTCYIASDFLQQIDIKYNSAQNYLKLNPQFDGPIVALENGFTQDFTLDPVTQLAEEGMLSDHIKALKISKSIIEKRFSIVTVYVSKSLTYVFILHKQQHQWLISDILVQ